MIARIKDFFWRLWYLYEVGPTFWHLTACRFGHKPRERAYGVHRYTICERCYKHYNYGD